jgi:photosystem II stability/assembly factor-like uncharacterized protein
LFIFTGSVVFMKSAVRLFTAGALIILAFFIFAKKAPAGINQWTSNGPYAGSITALAISPNYAADQTVYAGTTGGLFKSANGGMIWTEVNAGYVCSLAISPNYAADQTVYAGTKGGAYKTTNGGASWAAVNTGITNPNVVSLTASPNYAIDQTVYAGTSGGVFKTTNGGAFWAAVNTGITNPNVASLAVSPNYIIDQTVYAGTSGGVFKTTNGGAVWTAVNTGITNINILSLAVSPTYATDQTVFAGTSGGGVFKTTNSGTAWTAANTGLTNLAVQSLTISPAYVTDRTVYAGTLCDMFKTTNGGTSWAAVNTGITNPHIASSALSPDYAVDRTVYAGTGTGVFKTTNAGAMWTAANTGIATLTISSLAVSPGYAVDQTMYAGTNGGLLFKTADGGMSWTAVLTISSSVESLAVSPDYAADQTLYAGSNYLIYKSADGGLSWTVENASYSNTNIPALALSPNFAVDRTVFAGCCDSTYDLFKTTNGGSIWYDTNTGIIDTRALAVSPDYAADQTVFAGTAYGVYKTTSAWSSWTAVNTGITNTNIQSLAVSPDYAVDQTVYAGSNAGGVYRSANGGASWTALNTGLTNTNIQALALSPDYAADQTVYAGSNAGGVYRSANGGASWTALNTGLTDTSVYSLSISPNYASDHKVFTGTGSGGVFNISFAPPASVISGPANGASLSGMTCTITGTASAAGSAAVQQVEVGITPSGGSPAWYQAAGAASWSCNCTLPAEGSYTILSRATDNMGNAETPGTGVTVTVDRTPPAVSAGENKTTNAIFTQTASAADANSMTYQWSKVNGPGTISFGTPTALSTTISASADGIYVIGFTATDAAGNSASAAMGLTWDTTAPSSAITAPAGPYASGTSCNITGTASDTGSGIQMVEVGITPDGGTTTWYDAIGTTSWNYSWTLPADGSYKIQSRATDNAGHVETPGTGISVTVDGSSPVIISPTANATLMAQYSPDLPSFSWIPNTCVKFKVAYSAMPDFKKNTLTAVSDNKGIGAAYNPRAASWNKITALGGSVFWKVMGITAQHKALNSGTQELVLDGGYSSVSDIPATDINGMPTMECDPGSSSSVKVEFSAEPYFVAPMKTPALTPGSLASYTPTSRAWKTLTRLGPTLYWRFKGKLPTGETTYSVTRTTAVTGGPAITDPADASKVTYPLTVSWDTAGFVSFVVQASAAPDFSTKPLALGSSKTGSLTLTQVKWAKLSALGSPVYIRVVGTTEEKYTAYGPAVKVSAEH